MYPKTVTFIFDWHFSYKAFIGGFISTLIHLAFFCHIHLTNYHNFNIKNSSTSIYKIAKDLTSYPEKQYFTKNNDIYFSYKLTGPNPEKLFDKIILHFKQSGYLYNSNNIDEVLVSSVSIEYELWENNFTEISNENHMEVYLSKYFGPRIQISLFELTTTTKNKSWFRST